MCDDTIFAGQISENDFLKMDLGRNYEFKMKLLVHDFKAIGWSDPWKNQAFKLTSNQEEIDTLLPKKDLEDLKNERARDKEYVMQNEYKEYG